MNFFPHYVYYRITKRFYRKDSDGVFAVCMISAVQLLIMVDSLILLSKLFVSREDTAPYAKTIAWIVGLIFICLAIVNFRKFHRKYWFFWEHWKDERPDDARRKGWVVFVSVATPFLILFLIGGLL